MKQMKLATMIILTPAILSVIFAVAGIGLLLYMALNVLMVVVGIGVATVSATRKFKTERITHGLRR